MSEILKILSVFFTSIFFFGKLGVPTAIVVFKYNFWEVILVTCAGGITGNFIFTYLSSYILKWRHTYRSEHNKIHRKKIFTRFNRNIIKIKKRFGLAGIAFITPLVGSPVGAFLAERFFKDKKKVVLYLSISIVFWSIALYFILYLFHDSLTGWLI